ncbi:MAG: FkbM family methyltransferase [Candidatus Thermoplasmatota archaeon]|nr:FkbM family methyltransferase [Candidatus Thermoplasmatota archaeon]
MSKKGLVKLSNGYSIPFDIETKGSILRIVYFALENGIRFGEEEYQWKLDYQNKIIETPQGIKFKINKVGLLDETFLYQIHFSGLELKNKVVVTAGAYIGDTPLFYSYYGAKVYGFEPDPISYAQALENIKLNPKLSEDIVLKNYAIGIDGDIDFPVNPKDSGGSSVYKNDGLKTIKIKSKSISTILHEFNVAEPFLLDLDIKGSEFSVIEDVSIKKFQRIRIEYSPYLVHSKNETLDYLLNKLKNYGFNKFRIYKHNNLRFDLLNHGTLEAEK